MAIKSFERVSSFAEKNKRSLTALLGAGSLAISGCGDPENEHAPCHPFWNDGGTVAEKAKFEKSKTEDKSPTYYLPVDQDEYAKSNDARDCPPFDIHVSAKTAEKYPKGARLDMPIRAIALSRRVPNAE